MQKTRKRSEPSTTHNSRHRYPVSLPEAVNTDVLGTMLDEDLVVRMRTLADDIEKVYESHLDPKPWEVEIAYLRREQQIRRQRRDTHSEYIRKEQELFERTEMMLPAGDFDNMAFVYAASGGRQRWN